MGLVVPSPSGCRWLKNRTSCEYVALEGGYVVRYTLDGSGTFEDYFRGGGTLHLVYDTYDVGAPIGIQAPRRS